MRLRLRASRHDVADYSSGKSFRFAVVDLDKAKDYPLNYVCMLPLQVVSDRKGHSSFVKIFGDKSVEVARKLLAEALKREDEVDVRREIERRLKLLEAKPVCEKICVSCGKHFQTKPRSRFRQKFCPECYKKRYGDPK